MIKEQILGIKVCATNPEELIQSVEKDIQNNRKGFIVAINPEKILKAKKDAALTSLLNNAEYPIADGVGVLLASRFRKGQIRKRITGIQMMELLCQAAARLNWRVFLYGAKPGVADKAANVLTHRYSGLQVVGTADGYANDQDALSDRINQSHADILFVALGSPAQENWIVQNRDRVDVKIFQGVGGSFDVICGNLRRAPEWMQRIGLEWLYRLLIEPKRIFRQLKLFRFFILLLFEGKQTYAN